MADMVAMFVAGFVYAINLELRGRRELHETEVLTSSVAYTESESGLLITMGISIGGRNPEFTATDVVKIGDTHDDIGRKLNNLKRAVVDTLKDMQNRISPA